MTLSIQLPAFGFVSPSTWTKASLGTTERDLIPPMRVSIAAVRFNRSPGSR